MLGTDGDKLDGGNKQADDLQSIMDLYRSDLINHVMSRLESTILENHEIFGSMTNMPKCLKVEILHQKILSKIEKIFQGIHYEIIFKDMQFKYQHGDFEQSPGGQAPYRYFDL